MRQFGIRDLFWLILLIAILLGGWIDRTQLQKRYAQQAAQQTIDANRRLAELKVEHIALFESHRAHQIEHLKLEKQLRAERAQKTDSN